MKNLLPENLANLINRLTDLKKITNTPDTILFDSINAAQEIAFTLGGKWDECNGVIVSKYDEVAVNTAAKLHNSSWCKKGDKKAVLIRLNVEELIRRYTGGERNFSNANLRRATLTNCSLPEINLSFAKLNAANLTEANLSKAELTAADLSGANLSYVDLSDSSLIRANLSKTNLSFADLRGANLQAANLQEACLYQADLRGTNLNLADLRRADLTEAKLKGANLTNTQLTLTESEKAALLI
ncbi:MAG: pentapeptide repeat-containing protein [Coleofasciculaceae cyanobacterium]